MNSKDLYLKKISNKIIASGKGITQVNSITFFKLLDYTFENKAAIHNLLIQKRINELENFPSNKIKNGTEDLLIFKFYDQNSCLTIVTVYDNDELWQDPQILDIYSLEKLGPSSALV